MTTLPEYLIKLSVSLAILYIFYGMVLNRLTFYQWNRVYLLGYSLLSFVLPFVNISPWIEKQGMENGTLARIPALGNYSLQPTGPGSPWSLGVWLSILLVTGMVVLLVRLLLSYLSLRRIRRQAVLWQAGDGVRLFDRVPGSILFPLAAPFISTSVFIPGTNCSESSSTKWCM